MDDTFTAKREMTRNGLSSYDGVFLLSGLPLGRERPDGRVLQEHAAARLVHVGHAMSLVQELAQKSGPAAALRHDQHLVEGYPGVN